MLADFKSRHPGLSQHHGDIRSPCPALPCHPGSQAPRLRPLLHFLLLPSPFTCPQQCHPSHLSGLCPLPPPPSPHQALSISLSLSRSWAAASPPPPTGSAQTSTWGPGTRRGHPAAQTARVSRTPIAFQKGSPPSPVCPVSHSPPTSPPPQPITTDGQRYPLLWPQAHHPTCQRSALVASEASPVCQLMYLILENTFSFTHLLNTCYVPGTALGIQGPQRHTSCP